MASSQRTPLIDQWRPEASSRRNQDRDRGNGERSVSRERGRSPASGAIRARGLGEPPRARSDFDPPPSSSSRHHPVHLRERSRSRRPRRSQERQDDPARRSREDEHHQGHKDLERSSRPEAHKHRRRHDSQSSTKRRRSTTPSPARDSHRRVKRRRSPSFERSPPPPRRSNASQKDIDRAFSPAPSANRVDRAYERRSSPDSYVRSTRRRSRSVESHHLRDSHRRRRHSPSPTRTPTARRPSPPPQSPHRHRDGRDNTRSIADKPRGHRSYPEDTRREPDLFSHKYLATARSRSPRRRRSPSPFAGRRRSPGDFRQGRPSSPARGRISDSSRLARRERSPASTHRKRAEDRRTTTRGDSTGEEVATRQRRQSRDPIPSGRKSDKRATGADDDMRPAYHQPGRPQRGNYSHSPPYMTPNQGSPHSQASYHSGRGGWGGQPQYGSHQGSPMHSYPPQQPPYQQPPYSPQGQYPNQQYNAPPPQAYHGSPPSRGAYRGNHFSVPPDRRFSGGNNHAYPPQPSRGRAGHFSNLSWTPATGVRGGTAPTNRATQPSQAESPAVGQTPQSTDTPADEEDNPFRPSKALRVEDQTTKEEEKKTPVTEKAAETGDQSSGGTKISFALKSKPPPTAAATKPDLTLKPSVNLDTRPPPAARPKPDPRDTPLDRRSESSYDRRDDRRIDDRRFDDRRRDDRRFDDRRYDDRRMDDRWMDDRRRDERRYDDRKAEPRYPEPRPPFRRPEPRPEPRAEPVPRKQEPPKTEIVKKKRMKARPTLPADYAASDSVYYRKPGNESVVGSGTYGKVFKAIHVYTKDQVALKRIRMEGERDGFPVTAVREIKLLQSLNHDNVVKLQEVMVEKNDCFMVFEYLSHDLTGLLNHPSFKLDQGQKKDLAKQLFEGLDYLHRRGVLHRDIKAANILVSSKGQLKLADFGLARFYVKRRKLDYTNRVITIWYRSPELLLGETQYGPSVDIWSAACVLVEIFTKHAIFPGDGSEINQLDKIYNVLGTPTREDWPGITEMQWFELLRPAERKPSTFAEKYKDRVTPEAFELLSAMFQYDPTARPSAADVLEHPYFMVDPKPKRAVELEQLDGDWHEFESKALRKEKEKQDKEARRAAREEHAREEQSKREGEKRRADELPGSEPEAKRARAEEDVDMMVA